LQAVENRVTLASMLVAFTASLSTMRSVLLLFLVPGLAAAAPPEGYVALTLSRSPFCLIGSTVRVSVAPGMAMVEGQYEYKYVPRFDHSQAAATVAFEFAVLVPRDTDSVGDVSDAMQPKLHLGSVDYTPDDLDVLKQPAGVTLAFVPDNRKVVLLVFDIPRALLRERCSLTLTYFQPSYRVAGQEVAAYLPLLPDFEGLKNELLFSRDDFTVEFEALGHVRLHRLSTNAVVAQEAPDKLTVHPVDREIIAVAVEPAGAAAAKPAAPAP